jgi:hypothetical protein
MRSLRLFTGLAVAALALAGCSGPKAPFDIGTQAAPLALVLGEHAAVETAPVGPISLPPVPGALPFVPPDSGATTGVLPTAAPTPLPSIGPCPDFNPLAAVAGVGLDVPGTPQPGTYLYRAQTAEAVGSAKTGFKGNSSWKVSVGAMDPLTGAYDVTIDVTAGQSTTTRVLRILTKPLAANQLSPSGQQNPLDAPDATDPNKQVIDEINGLALLPVTIPRDSPNAGRYGPAGIYLVEQSTSVSTFKPSLPIPLLQTPVGNNSFTAYGTDGSTVMTFVSTVSKRAYVNACGKKVETWEVALTAGEVATRTVDNKIWSVGFTENLDFGLQYGGLPLHDEGTVTGIQVPGSTPTGDQITRSFNFTINSLPKPAKVLP